MLPQYFIVISECPVIVTKLSTRVPPTNEIVGRCWVQNNRVIVILNRARIILFVETDQPTLLISISRIIWIGLDKQRDCFGVVRHRPIVVVLIKVVAQSAVHITVN